MSRLERPRVTRIEAVEEETDRHATVRFYDAELAAAPAGSFCMVWMPGVDEVPMGIGYTDVAGRVTLTIEGKGDCTRALLALESGDRIGVRGPHGNEFHLPETPGKVCFVGGGTGIAPMARGAQEAAAAGHEVTVISGARSAELLLLHATLSEWRKRQRVLYMPCTDDGSFGFPGLTTQRLEALWNDGESFDAVYACGPEPMMVRVVDLCRERGVPVEVSLERYMKCAIGICDACTVGGGKRVCVEGPVFSAEALEAVKEFGVGHRDAAGVLYPW